LTSRRRFGACLAILFLAGVDSAPASDVAAVSPSPPAEREAISPIPSPPEADPAKVALGEQLFADPRLSGDGKHSCLSCHDIRTNGAGSHRFDTGVDGAKLRFNTLTVFDAALSFRLGWEGKSRTLEAEAEVSLDNPQLMGTSVEQAVKRLGADPELASRFSAIYGHAINRSSLLDVISTYERTLLTPGSPFDRWLEGDKDAISTTEQEGYRLFKSLGCISCHQGVNVGGNLFERPGIFSPLTSSSPGLLRVPSLRNVAVTAPYFDDGSVATLDEAVRKMGTAQLDRALSDQQVAAIVAFLGSLTGTYRGVPVTAPSP